MQIVIEIPNKIYESVQDGTYCGTLYEELKNGIPLPKGHGELKDTKAILDKFDETYNSKVGLIPDNLAEGFMQCEKLIKIAQTLVKADKESEGDE